MEQVNVYYIIVAPNKSTLIFLNLYLVKYLHAQLIIKEA